MPQLVFLLQIIGIFFLLIYAYRVILYPIAFIGRFRQRLHPQKEARQIHHFGVLICGRNEAAVIGDLIHSLRQQDYPREKLDIFVCADNCTDDTASLARQAGAICYERFNQKEIGKGYALNFLLTQIRRDRLDRGIEAWLVFDADNLLEPGYLQAMNRHFDQGELILTSCRASKNFSDNWLSAAYAYGFLHDAIFVNYAKSLIGLSAAVSGTGFLVADSVIQHFHGWPFHLLTEDLEFTSAATLAGYKIGYCPDAIFYDEQPTDFAQSWTQRLRWTKGSLQVFCRYWKPLLRRAWQHRELRSLEILVVTLPVNLLLAISWALYVFMLFATLVNPSYTWQDVLPPLCLHLNNNTFPLMAMALLTCVASWRLIPAHPVLKIATCVTYPIYMLSYIPIMVHALFTQVTWKPVRHGVTKEFSCVPKV